LKIFRAAMIHGSATGAAVESNITQPAASRAIKEFEDIVGFRLFVRERSGLRPTQEAELLYEEVQRAYAAFDLVEQTARAIKKKAKGRLRVAALPVYADGLVSQVLAGFVEQYPGISVRLISARKTEIESLVATGQVDVGVTTLPVQADLLRTASQIERAAVCVFPKDCPLKSKKVVTLADLQQYRIVHLVKGSPLRSFLEVRFAEQGLDPVIDIEVGTQQAIVNMVTGGSGVGIVDPDIISDMNDDLLISRPLSPPLIWTLAMVVAVKSTTPAITQSFIEWMKRQAQ
jgi:DNA-binding transcriptional LysR family regulator